MPNPFHLAIPVADLDKTKEFYINVLRCEEGRNDTRWQDLDFFGHQVALHLVDDYQPKFSTNKVDGHDVPAGHFGVVLDWDDWHDLEKELTARNTSYVIKPYTRFKGKVGEQATMFFNDPSGNVLEFKSFKNKSSLFEV